MFKKLKSASVAGMVFAFFNKTCMEENKELNPMKKKDKEDASIVNTGKPDENNEYPANNQMEDQVRPEYVSPNNNGSKNKED